MIDPTSIDTACSSNGLAVVQSGRLSKAECDGASDKIWAPRDFALCEVTVNGLLQNELLYFLPGLPPSRPKGMLSIGTSTLVGDVIAVEPSTAVNPHSTASLTRAWLEGGATKSAEPPLPPAEAGAMGKASTDPLASVRPKLHRSNAWKKVRRAVKASASIASTLPFSRSFARAHISRSPSLTHSPRSSPHPLHADPAWSFQLEAEGHRSVMLGCDDREVLEAWRSALVGALAVVKSREAELEEQMYAIDPDSKVADDVMANPTFELSGRVASAGGGLSSRRDDAAKFAMGRYVRDELEEHGRPVYKQAAAVAGRPQHSVFYADESFAALPDVRLTSKWVVCKLPENEPRMFAISDAATPGEVLQGQWQFSRGWVKAPQYTIDFPAALDDAAHDDSGATASVAALIDEWKGGVRAQLAECEAEIAALQVELAAGTAASPGNLCPLWTTSDSGPDIAIDQDGSRVTRTNSSSWGTQVTDPFTTDTTFSLLITNTSNYLYVGVLNPSWTWNTSSNPQNGSSGSRFYHAENGELKSGDTVVPQSPSNCIPLKGSDIELEVRVDMAAHTVTFTREGGSVVGTLPDVSPTAVLFATFGGSDQYVSILSAGSAALRQLKNQISAAQQKKSLLEARLAAPVTHGWEWKHPDGTWRKLADGVGMKLFSEHGAGEAIFEHALQIMDGSAQTMTGRHGAKVDHIVLDERAVGEQIFSIEANSGGLDGDVVRGPAASGGANSGAGAAGAATKAGSALSATLSGSNPSIITKEQFLPKAYSMSRPDLGVSQTTAILSFAGHFKFTAGSSGDFLRLKMGSSATPNDEGVIEHGASFTFGCATDASQKPDVQPLAWASKRGNDIAIDQQGARVTRTNSSSWGTQVSDPITTDTTIKLKIDNSSDYLAIGVIGSDWTWSSTNFVASESSSRYYYADGTLHKGGDTEKSGVANLKSMGIELEIRVDMGAKTVTFVREGGVVVGTLADVPSSPRFFACFGGSSQYVAIAGGGGISARFADAIYNGSKIKKKVSIVAGVDHTFEVLWDGTHGQAHCWVGKTALSGSYDATRLQLDGSGPAKYLGCTDVGPNAAEIISKHSGRLTVGDKCVLAGPCSKSGLTLGEVGTICKDDHDSRPYKVTCAAGTSDYYTEAEIVAVPNPSAGIEWGHIVLSNSGAKNCGATVESLRLSVFKDPTASVARAEEAASDPDSSFSSCPTGSVVFDLSAKPMVMRDPVTKASVALRGFHLNEPVPAIAPSTLCLTGRNPIFDPDFLKAQLEAAAEKLARDQMLEKQRVAREALESLAPVAHIGSTFADAGVAAQIETFDSMRSALVACCKSDVTGGFAEVVSSTGGVVYTLSSGTALVSSGGAVKAFLKEDIDLPRLVWKEARVCVIDDEANGVDPATYPFWLPCALTAIACGDVWELAIALRREGDRGARNTPVEVCFADMATAVKETGFRREHITPEVLQQLSLVGAVNDDLFAIATKSNHPKCAALLQRLNDEWRDSDLSPEEEYTVEEVCTTAWVTSTKGNDIQLDMDDTRVTRTNSSSWGTQVSEPFDVDTTINVKIDNSSSDYFAIGVVDANWSWSGTTFVSSESTSRYYYADGTLHSGGNTITSGLKNLKDTGIELEVRVDMGAKTVTFVREGGVVIGTLADIPASARFFACFGGSGQFVTIVPGGGANAPRPKKKKNQTGTPQPIAVGDKVRVKMDISKPSHGWGSVSAGDVGTVTALSGDGCTIDFAAQSGWSGLTAEMERPDDDGAAADGAADEEKVEVCIPDGFRLPRPFEALQVGTVVVRGPDWKWGEQDRAEGSTEGSVDRGVTTSPVSESGWVSVAWANELETTGWYRVGATVRCGGFDTRPRFDLFAEQLASVETTEDAGGASTPTNLDDISWEHDEGLGNDIKLVDGDSRVVTRTNSSSWGSQVSGIIEGSCEIELKVKHQPGSDYLYLGVCDAKQVLKSAWSGSSCITGSKSHMITYKANGDVQANGEDRPKQPALHGVHDLKMTLDLEAHTIVFACDGGDGCEPMKYKGDWEQVRIFCCFGSSDQVITIVSIVGGGASCSLGGAWWLGSAEEQVANLESTVHSSIVDGGAASLTTLLSGNRAVEAALEYVAISETIVSIDAPAGRAAEDIDAQRFIHLLSGERVSERILRERGVSVADVVAGVTTRTELMELCSLGVYHRHEAKSNGRSIFHNENGRFMMYHSDEAGEWRVAQRRLVDEALSEPDKGGAGALTGSSGDRKWLPGPVVLKCPSKNQWPGAKTKFLHEGGWAPDENVAGKHPEASQSDLLHALINRDSSSEAEAWARAMRDAGTDETYESPAWALQDDPECNATWEFEAPVSSNQASEAVSNSETTAVAAVWKVFDAVSVEILTRAYVRRLPEVSLPHLPGNIVVNLKALYREHSVSGVITRVRGTICGMKAVAGFHESERPEIWTPQRTDIVTVDVEAESAEWASVLARFCEHVDDISPEKSGTIAMPKTKVRIYKIQRVQNIPLFALYERKRKQIAQRSGGVDNERSLFHGTGTSPPSSIYASYGGFEYRSDGGSDHPMSTNASLGRAAYFSTSAEACNSFAHRIPLGGDSAKQLLLCRTVCGQHHEGGSLGAVLPSEGPGGVLCDSHTGYPAEIGGARSFAIFDSTQAYPEYVVTFKSPEPLDLEEGAIETVLFELEAAHSADAVAADPSSLHDEALQGWIDAFGDPRVARADGDDIDDVMGTAAGGGGGGAASGGAAEGFSSANATPQRFRWLESELGQDISVGQNGLSMTRTNSSSWGTQVSGLINKNGTLRMKITNDSDYMYFGLLGGSCPFNWKSSGTPKDETNEMFWMKSDGSIRMEDETRGANSSNMLKGTDITVDMKFDFAKRTMILSRTMPGEAQAHVLHTYIGIPEAGVRHFATMGGSNQTFRIIGFATSLAIATFNTGDIVRVKPAVSAPRFGWQGTSVDHSCLGVISAFVNRKGQSVPETAKRSAFKISVCFESQPVDPVTGLRVPWFADATDLDVAKAWKHVDEDDEEVSAAVVAVVEDDDAAAAESSASVTAESGPPAFIVASEPFVVTAAAAVKTLLPDSLGVGDYVRVKSSISKPSKGWGSVSAGDVGRVQSISGTDFRADFPAQSNWGGVSAEMERVRPDGGLPFWVYRDVSPNGIGLRTGPKYPGTRSQPTAPIGVGPNTGEFITVIDRVTKMVAVDVDGNSCTPRKTTFVKIWVPPGENNSGGGDYGEKRRNQWVFDVVAYNGDQLLELVQDWPNKVLRATEHTDETIIIPTGHSVLRAYYGNPATLWDTSAGAGVDVTERVRELTEQSEIAWEWEDGNLGSGDWKPFDVQCQALFKGAASLGSTTLTLQFGSTPYKVDTIALTQTNTSTNYARNIRGVSSGTPITASNDLFTDPCSGVSKVLVVEVVAEESAAPIEGEWGMSDLEGNTFDYMLRMNGPTTFVGKQIRFNSSTCDYDVRGEVSAASTKCRQNHDMVVSSFAGGGYTGGYVCDLCRGRSSSGHLGSSRERWWCQACTSDFCFECRPASSRAVNWTVTIPGGSDVTYRGILCGAAIVDGSFQVGSTAEKPFTGERVGSGAAAEGAAADGGAAGGSSAGAAEKVSDGAATSSPFPVYLKIDDGLTTSSGYDIASMRPSNGVCQLRFSSTFVLPRAVASDEFFVQLGATNQSEIVLERSLAPNEIITLEANWDLAHCKVRVFAESRIPGGTRTSLLCSDPMKRGGRSLAQGRSTPGGARLTVGDRCMLSGPCSKSGLVMGEIGVICKVRVSLSLSLSLSLSSLLSPLSLSLSPLPSTIADRL